MNLYKFHTNPESLKHYDVAHEHVPQLKWEQLVGQSLHLIDTDTEYEYDTDAKDDIDLAEVKKYEHLWAKDTKTAYYYAHSILNAEFPAGEKAIAKDGYYAYMYARDVLKAAFPAGEKAISTDVHYASMYAMKVLKKRFPAGEKVIAQHLSYRRKYEKVFNIMLPN